MTVRTRSATADGASWALASQAASRSHARASGASPSAGRPFGERVIVASRLNRSCSRAQLSASDAVFSCRVLIQALNTSRGSSAPGAKASAIARRARSSGAPARSFARVSRSVSARDGRGIALLIRRVVRAPDCRGAGAPPAGAGVAAVRAAGRRDAGALPAEARLAVLGADRLLVLRRRRRAWAIAPKIAGEGRGAPFCGGYS